MVGPRHDGLPSGAGHGLGDLGCVGRDGHRPDSRLHGPAPHMDDHGFARDLGEGLVRQADRGEAGGDEDDGIRHGAVFNGKAARP